MKYVAHVVGVHLQTTNSTILFDKFNPLLMFSKCSPHELIFVFSRLCFGLMVAGGAGGQVHQEEIHSFVTRGLPDAAAASKAEEEINWAELDDLAPEWDRVESGIDDLLSLSTTYWEPGLGPRAPRKAAGKEGEDNGKYCALSYLQGGGSGNLIPKDKSF